MSEKYSEWHKLRVGWYEPVGDGIWSTRRDDPVPDDLVDEIDWDYEFTHPAECGHGCFFCGSHQTCGIDYDIAQIGLFDAFGQERLAPGLYAARQVVDVWKGPDGAEVSTWIESELAESDDPRFEGFPE